MAIQKKENITEYYYTQLKSTTNPGNLLARFFADVHKLPNATKKEIIMFNRLLSLFSRFLIFFVVLKTADTDFGDRDPYPYLLAVCRDRFESSHGVSTVAHTTDLTRMVNRLAKELEKTRKVSVPDDILED